MGGRGRKLPGCLSKVTKLTNRFCAKFRPHPPFSPIRSKRHVSQKMSCMLGEMALYPRPVSASSKGTGSGSHATATLFKLSGRRRFGELPTNATCQIQPPCTPQGAREFARSPTPGRALQWSIPLVARSAEPRTTAVRPLLGPPLSLTAGASTNASHPDCWSWFRPP